MTEHSKRKELLKNTRQIIVFIGAEGSGKTDNALKLAEETGLPYISTGDILRDLADNDFETKYGEACRIMLDGGQYLDGEMLLEILANRLKEPDTANGFILDGGMRTLEETEKFHLILEMAGRDTLPLKTILLDIPDELSFVRLIGENGRNRDKDTVEGVASRLSNYHYLLEQRLEIIEKRENWQLKRVDATVSFEDTYERVVEMVLNWK